MGLFFVAITVLFSLQAVKCCIPGVTETYGNVTQDQDLEVGSTLRIRCFLFEEAAIELNAHAKNLSLERDGVKLNVTIIDNLTIEYVVPSSTVNDGGYYYCYANAAKYHTLTVCSTFVQVGYKPLPVKSFSCISESYKNLTCVWEPPENSVRTVYTLYDWFLKPVLNRTCPVRLNATSCQFRLDTSPNYVTDHPQLHLILEGKNSLGTNCQSFTLDHYSIIKPGKPKFMLCTNVTQNSLLMRWNAPKGLEYGQFNAGLYYEIKYYSISTNLQGTEVLPPKFAKIDLITTIHDLVPHTLYQFEVRVRVNVSSDNYYWSEYSRHTEETKSDVPYLAPETQRSAFEYQIYAGNSGYRSVTLYWKGVPSEFENGKDFRYMIQYHEHHVHRYRRGLVQTRNDQNFWVDVENRTSYTIDSLDVNSAYIFNILSVNEMGKSTNHTSIVIVDKLEKMLHPPKEIAVIYYGEGNYSLEWKDVNREVTHFTVFWCAKTRPNKCDGPIDWIKTSETSRELLLPDYPTSYQFAVAANLDFVTSGMVWAKCVVSNQGVRYTVSEMQLVKKNDTSLKIQWSLACDAQEKVIQKYLISYCPFHGKCVQTGWKCDADWANVTVANSSKREYTLSSLKPFTCYYANISVLSNSGWSEVSKYVYESTMEAAPSDSPRNVVAAVVRGNGDSIEIKIEYEEPLTPNGIITKYRIYYNESSTDVSRHIEVEPNDFIVTIAQNIHYYTNYSIQVSACVKQSCSRLSPPVYAFTGISYPSPIHPPRIELFDATMNVTWAPPDFPNGPVDFYEVELYSNVTDKRFQYRVNESTSLSLPRDCEAVDSDESVYDFRIRAVNLADSDGRALYGEYSLPTKTVICPRGKSIWFYIGVIVAGAVTFILCASGFSWYIKKCWMEYRARKNINIKLPLELETPFGNSLNSFDKLKNGLQKTAPDASIPCDRAYERLCSFQHAWGDNDALSNRNNSGESNKSGVSSADTTRTAVSMDSSLEQERDTADSSSNPSQSDAAMADDLEPLPPGPFISNNISNTTFSRCFVRANYAAMGKSDQLGFMPAYSKFGEIPISPLFSEEGATGEISFSPQSDIPADSFLQNLYKINSEPSLFCEDLPEVASFSDAPPYSKFGLARSNTHVHTLNRPSVGYSRFGAMHNPTVFNPQVFTAFVTPTLPLSVMYDEHQLPTAGNTLASGQNSFTPTLPLPVMSFCDERQLKAGTTLASGENSFQGPFGAYSTVGVGTPNGESAIKYASKDDYVKSIDVDAKTTDSSPYIAADVASHQIQINNNQSQDMSDDVDDPRLLSEILAADERFSSIQLSQIPPLPCNVTVLNHCEQQQCNGVEENATRDITNNVAGSNHKSEDSWNHVNGHYQPILPLRVDTYDDPEPLCLPQTVNYREKPAASNYILHSELEKQNLYSVNSIDTHVASV